MPGPSGLGRPLTSHIGFPPPGRRLFIADFRRSRTTFRPAETYQRTMPVHVHGMAPSNLVERPKVNLDTEVQSIGLTRPDRLQSAGGAAADRSPRSDLVATLRTLRRHAVRGEGLVRWPQVEVCGPDGLVTPGEACDPRRLPRNGAANLVLPTAEPRFFPPPPASHVRARGLAVCDVMSETASGREPRPFPVAPTALALTECRPTVCPAAPPARNANVRRELPPGASVAGARARREGPEPGNRVARSSGKNPCSPAQCDGPPECSSPASGPGPTPGAPLARCVGGRPWTSADLHGPASPASRPVGCREPRFVFLPFCRAECRIPNESCPARGPAACPA